MALEIKAKDVQQKKEKLNCTTFKEYEKIVREITKSQPLFLLKNFDKRGFNNYHVDHIISIFRGYKNNIYPEIIGNINNLQMITRDENMKKQHQCYSVIDACNHMKTKHSYN